VLRENVALPFRGVVQAMRSAPLNKISVEVKSVFSSISFKSRK
jgi:hypothetical protein